jgi:hypothetical protein
LRYYYLLQGKYLPHLLQSLLIRFWGWHNNYSACDSQLIFFIFYHVQSLINPIIPDEPDPSAANALQEGLGGQFGEMRTMMLYLFQSFNFRGNALPYFDLILGVGIEKLAMWNTETALSIDKYEYFIDK